MDHEEQIGEHGSDERQLISVQIISLHCDMAVDLLSGSVERLTMINSDNLARIGEAPEYGQSIKIFCCLIGIFQPAYWAITVIVESEPLTTTRFFATTWMARYRQTVFHQIIAFTAPSCRETAAFQKRREQ